MLTLFFQGLLHDLARYLARERLGTHDPFCNSAQSQAALVHGSDTRVAHAFADLSALDALPSRVCRVLLGSEPSIELGFTIELRHIHHEPVKAGGLFVADLHDVRSGLPKSCASSPFMPTSFIRFISFGPGTYSTFSSSSTSSSRRLSSS